ncbi:DUF4348 domain-containing protein [Flavobacterium saccharophilum]|uniref:DUF4348 domain-containing protein n=1 Tax=Flavobacterium saccharophilum TaxID=29534 RepID=A0A1M7M529_9FLAO|nr:DUF4348 domain-containing protein [Flavobacterium saccharophilum]SHM85798.1 protein of unknown function [Flavobacterium saccharophilum]
MNQKAIVLLFFIAFLFFNCKNEIVKQKIKKQEITEQKDKNAAKQNPKVANENFEMFLDKFSQDSIFQISRVKFPLKVKEIDLESMVELDENKSDFKERTILKSDYTKLDFTYPKDALTRELDRYTQKIKIKNNRAVVEIRGVDNGIYSDFYFEKIDGKWFLQTWKEQST